MGAGSEVRAELGTEQELLGLRRCWHPTDPQGSLGLSGGSGVREPGAHVQGQRLCPGLLGMAVLERELELKKES